MSHRGQSHLKTITRARPVSLKPPIQHLLCIGACTRRLFWRLFLAPHSSSVYLTMRSTQSVLNYPSYVSLDHSKLCEGFLVKTYSYFGLQLSGLALAKVIAWYCYRSLLLGFDRYGGQDWGQKKIEFSGPFLQLIFNERWAVMLNLVNSCNIFLFCLDGDI